MKSYIIRNVAKILASLLVLIPAVLLLAWESKIPNVAIYWMAVLLGSGALLYGVYRYEVQFNAMTIKRFISKCGGFVVMFGFILYKTLTVLI